MRRRSPATVTTPSTWWARPSSRVDEVDDLRVAEATERQPEVERRAGHDDDVGLALEQAACARERELVVGGQAPAAEPVHERRDAQVLDRGAQLVPRARPVHVGAGDERGSLGARRSGRPRAASASASGSSPRCTPCRSTSGISASACANSDVDREVEEHRAAVRAERGRDRLVDLLRDVCGRGDRRAASLVIDDTQRHVVELLQRPGAPARLRRPATEHDERRAVEVRGGDRAHPVGDAGTRGQHRDAGTARQLRRALGREGRGLLVADVDDARLRRRASRPRRRTGRCGRPTA